MKGGVLRFSPLEKLAELLHGGVEARLVEIELRAVADEREADLAQGFCDELGVIRGVRERRDALVGGVADHKRDALVGVGGGSERAGEEREGCRRDDGARDNPRDNET